MVKSGLIVGVITLILAFGGTLLTPLCPPCLSLFLGLAAGYLAGVFDSPPGKKEATNTGALAGLFGGVCAVTGQMFGTVANALIMGPQGTLNFVQDVGLPTQGSSNFETGYWSGLIGGAVCFSLLDVGLMVGLGALGGLLWWTTRGKKSV